jgi:hypothetical protein
MARGDRFSRWHDRPAVTARPRFALLGICVSASTAHAESPPRNAVSLRPLALESHGLAAMYERDLAPSRFSVAGELGIRDGVSGDYDALTISAAGELRWWLRLGAAGSELDPSAMIGPFVALRLVVARASVRDVTRDRALGSFMSIKPGAAIGYRLALFRHVEVSASLGPALSVEMGTGSRLPAALTPTMSFGLSVGWLF